MAKFTVGDWIEVTPTKDTAWEHWDDANHSYYCGKVGQILEIEENPLDPNEKFVKVQSIFTDAEGNDGYYEAWFLDKHLIITTRRAADRAKYDEKLQQHYLKAGRELQEWEESKRKHVDDCLRHVFGKKEPAPVELPPDEELKDWETAKTDPMFTAITNDQQGNLFTEEELDDLLAMFGDPASDTAGDIT